MKIAPTMRLGLILKATLTTQAVNKVTDTQPTSVYQRWIDAVKDNNIEASFDCYTPNAILVPTLRFNDPQP